MAARGAHPQFVGAGLHAELSGGDKIDFTAEDAAFGHNRRGGILPRPRAGQSPAPTNNFGAKR
jgi:hypothetical protein